MIIARVAESYANGHPALFRAGCLKAVWTISGGPSLLHCYPYMAIGKGTIVHLDFGKWLQTFYQPQY